MCLCGLHELLTDVFTSVIYDGDDGRHGVCEPSEILCRRRLV